MASTPYETLQHRAFRNFLAFRAASAMASEIVMVAVGWHLYLLTGSAFALGLVGLLQALPVITLALWSGLAGQESSRSACDPLFPPARAGRGVFIQSSNKLGEFESGVAATLLETGPSVVVGGGLTLLCVALTARLFPSLRRLDSLPSPHDTITS